MFHAQGGHLSLQGLQTYLPPGSSDFLTSREVRKLSLSFITCFRGRKCQRPCLLQFPQIPRCHSEGSPPESNLCLYCAALTVRLRVPSSTLPTHRRAAYACWCSRHRAILSKAPPSSPLPFTRLHGATGAGLRPSRPPRAGAGRNLLSAEVIGVYQLHLTCKDNLKASGLERTC